MLQALENAGLSVTTEIIISMDHFEIVESLQQDDYILTRHIIHLLMN